MAGLELSHLAVLTDASNPQAPRVSSKSTGEGGIVEPASLKLTYGAREFGNLCAQLENYERRIIIHARPVPSAAPSFRYRARDQPERASAAAPRGAVEVGRYQLLDFEGLKPNVAPQPRDVAIEQDEVAVHRTLRAAIMA
jgi:hypothetical protein